MQNKNNIRHPLNLFGPDGLKRVIKFLNEGTVFLLWAITFSTPIPSILRFTDMQVLKFGGTSMGNEHNWRRVLDIINQYQQPFVVVSATARTTRQLLQAAHTALNNQSHARKQTQDIQRRHRKLISNFLGGINKPTDHFCNNCFKWIEQKINTLNGLISDIHSRRQLDPKTKDAVAAIGEQLSSYLLAQCGKAYGLSTHWIDAGKVIRTDSTFGNAVPIKSALKLSANKQFHELKDMNIGIMGGFYGQDQQGNTTTLGFEGSDYSASLVGAATGAETIDIWTDVSGIYTCDPRMVKKAKPIPELSFQQATELAYFGAKVLHPLTTKPAFQQDIPIRIKNIFRPKDTGSRITSSISYNGRSKAMTFKKEVLILTITSGNTVMGHQFLADIFQALNKYQLAVDVVVTTEASISIALERESELIQSLRQRLEPLGQVKITPRQGIISLIGCNADRTQDLVNDVLESLNSEKINLISFSQSKRNLNVVLDQRFITEAVRNIHRRIFES